MICGIVAKTSNGRERLRADLSGALPPGFPQSSLRWWHDEDAGVALSDAATHTDAARRSPCALAMTADIVDIADSSASGAVSSVDIGFRDLLLQRSSRTGLDAVARLRGGFALAHWDAERRQLTLVRDHFGQHNLFLRDDGDLWLLCSELGPLIEDPVYRRALDVESAFHFLNFGMPPPARTLAAGIRCVPAAHALTWAPGQPMFAQRYYSPIGFDDRKVADAAWRDHITSILDAAIAARDGGGRGALLLSGGVDSSYIAATCAARHGGDGYDAYTIAFVDGDVENEANYAAIVARAAGMRHHVVPMSVADAGEGLREILTAPHPCSAWAAATHRHLLARIAADGHRTLLSGLGADEVFGGYSQYLRFYKILRAQAERWPADSGVDAFDGLLWQPSHARDKLFAGVPRFFDRQAQVAGLHPPFDGWSHAPWLIEFYRECRRLKPDAHFFELMVAHECQHRVPDLLLAGFEQIARNVGVTTRYPFLDPNVATVACALGASERFWISGKRWQNKKVLRRIALDRIPTEIITRKPVSYNAPIRRWLKDPHVGGRILDAARASGLWTLRIVRREWFDHLIDVVLAVSAPAPRTKLAVEQLWILIVLCAWYDHWLGAAHHESH